MENVVFDFDGVIHSYSSGWKGATVIPDPPVPGIRETILELSTRYFVVIVSSRCIFPGGAKAIREWLDKYDIQGVEDILPEKPPARCYIDDRAIRFDGNAELLVEQVDKFVPWTQREFTMSDKIRNSTTEKLIDIFLEKGEPIGWRLDEKGMTYQFYAPHKQKEIIMDYIGQMIEKGICTIQLSGGEEDDNGTYKVQL